jgi:hypothetical protein
MPKPVNASVTVTEDVPLTLALARLDKRQAEPTNR